MCVDVRCRHGHVRVGVFPHEFMNWFLWFRCAYDWLLCQKKNLQKRKFNLSISSISKHILKPGNQCDNVTMWQQWGRQSVKPWNHGTLGWSIHKMPAKSHRLQSLHASTYHRHSSLIITVHGSHFSHFNSWFPTFGAFFLGLLVKTHRFSYVKAWAHSFKIPKKTSLATHFELRQVLILLIPNSLFRVFHPALSALSFQGSKSSLAICTRGGRVCHLLVLLSDL